MATLKLPEPYSVSYLRSQVRDALSYHGEQVVLLRLFHPEIDDVGTCPRCSNDSYRDGEEICPVCLGTNMYDYKTQIGGVKEAHRAWAVFTDHTVTETTMNYGVVAPDQRQVQTEAFPMLIQNDVIVRVKYWDNQTHAALSPGEFYKLGAVTRNSLRTGAHYGQTRDDVVGQSAQVTLLPNASNGICLYPIQGVEFPEFTIVGTTRPIAIGQPDDKVIYVPVPAYQPEPGAGRVIGASLEWNPMFTFYQNSSVTPWIINHTLDHEPAVTIIVDGVEVDANVTYPSPGVVEVNFESPQSGTAGLT